MPWTTTLCVLEYVLMPSTVSDLLLPALQTLRGRQQAKQAGHRIKDALHSIETTTLYVVGHTFMPSIVSDLSCTADAERQAAG